MKTIKSLIIVLQISLEYIIKHSFVYINAATVVYTIALLTSRRTLLLFIIERG